MKKLLAILISSSIATAAIGSGAIVNFFFTDAFGRPQPNRKFTLQPVPNLSPATNNLGQITGDAITANTDTNGNCTLTNVQIGTYREVFFGPTVATTNYLLIQSTNTVNAKDVITVYPAGLAFILYDESGTVGGRIVWEP